MLLLLRRGFLGLDLPSAGFCEGRRWDKIKPCHADGHTVRFAMLELYAMCRRMRRRSIRTLVTQGCQGEYDLSKKRKKKIKQAGWLGVCLPRLSPACLPDRLPACLCRTASPSQKGWIECLSVGPWAQIFLLDSIFFFFLLPLFRHGRSYAVSLTQKSPNVSLFGRDQLAKGCVPGPGWIHIGPQDQASASNKESERVTVSLFAEGQDAGPSRANHWRDLGAVSACSGLAGQWLVVR